MKNFYLLLLFSVICIAVVPRATPLLGFLYKCEVINIVARTTGKLREIKTGQQEK